MNKQPTYRVTLFLEEEPYKVLRMRAAEENTSMSDVIMEFLKGNSTTNREVADLEKEKIRCMVEKLTNDAYANLHCEKEGTIQLIVPDNWGINPGVSVLLCEEHFKEVAKSPELVEDGEPVEPVGGGKTPGV